MQSGWQSEATVSFSKFTENDRERDRKCFLDAGSLNYPWISEEIFWESEGFGKILSLNWKLKSSFYKILFNNS